MQLVRRFQDQRPRFEYGLHGIRLLPWEGLRTPFGGGYCIVAPRSASACHVNSPADEEEIFICIRGCAEVVIDDCATAVQFGDVIFIPRSATHFVRNNSDEPFHFYTVWWNRQSATDFLGNR